MVKRLFKIGWVILLLFSLCVFAWEVFITYITHGLFDPDEQNLTWSGFIIPNTLSAVLLIVYTKELLIGYTPIRAKRNTISLGVLLVAVTIILLSQQEFYTKILLDPKTTAPLVFPIVLILTSFLGLILNRAFYLIPHQTRHKSSQDE